MINMNKLHMNVQDLETSEKPVGFVSVSHFLQKKQDMSPVFFPDSAPAQDCNWSNVIHLDLEISLQFYLLLLGGSSQDLFQWLGSPSFIYHEWPFGSGTSLLWGLTNQGF